MNVLAWLHNSAMRTFFLAFRSVICYSIPNLYVSLFYIQISSPSKVTIHFNFQFLHHSLLVPVVKFHKFLATQSQCRYNKGVLKIHNHVRQVKASEEIGVKFMQRWEEEAMWKREGREKGQILGQISIIRFQYLTRQMTPVQISDILGLAPKFVQQICDLLSEHPQNSDEELADYFLNKNK